MTIIAPLTNVVGKFFHFLFQHVLQIEILDLAKVDLCSICFKWISRLKFVVTNICLIEEVKVRSLRKKNV